MKTKVRYRNGDFVNTKHYTQVLAAIEKAGVRPQIASLAKELGLPKSTVHDVYRRLEESYDLDALVVVRRKEDSS